ncbi:MAG: hypothetical protein A3H32_09360 [Betaproteobacteria bacterium RIFCSPLOWO2_02_FULL_63_19]|nr:MAG: hypothetical protein A3H32_09360 [Betaproteobacteria bacterium RIFCSPLOWO2_02_FULL_63_19]
MGPDDDRVGRSPTGSVSLNTAAAWHLEHKQFEQLLAFLEGQLAILRSGETPNYDLMGDVTNYICHFGARYHQAREAAAFGYILQDNPAMSGTIHRLVREHAQIAAKGEDLDALLARTVAGDAATQIADVLAGFLAAYRSHIATEERDILPYAEANLSAAHWERVAGAAPQGPDPFMRFATSKHRPTFGSEAQTRYRTLSERIQSGRSARPSAWSDVHRVHDGVARNAVTAGGRPAALPRRSLLVPDTAAARRLLVRQTMELLLLSLAFLQYHLLNIQLHIMELPSVFQELFH